MKKALILFALPLFVSAPAFAQAVGDACDSTAMPPPPLACSGDQLLGCVSPMNAMDPAQANTYQVLVDCAQDLAQAGGGSCQDVAGMGPICAMATGALCIIPTQQGAIHFPCAGAGEGCGTSDGSYVCTAGAPTCTGGDTFAATCSGNKAVWGCDDANQAIYDDCDAIGGTCQDGLGCVSVGVGGICDGENGQFDGANGPFWTCAQGLTCEGLSAESYGACAQGGGGNNPGTDAGTGGGGGGGGTDGGTRNDDEEPAPTPACSGVEVAATGMPAAFALVGLLGLAVIRRRR